MAGFEHVKPLVHQECDLVIGKVIETDSQIKDKNLGMGLPKHRHCPGETFLVSSYLVMPLIYLQVITD